MRVSLNDEQRGRGGGRGITREWRPGKRRAGRAIQYDKGIRSSKGCTGPCRWTALRGGAGQRDEMDAALNALRARVDQQPIAFRLLPATFTLSELQRVYEMLLGRKLHKASFRRALHAASLVEATDEWRSEGRGRPAQLFRYAPPRRRRARRGVRFDALG